MDASRGKETDLLGPTALLGSPDTSRPSSRNREVPTTAAPSTTLHSVTAKTSGRGGTFAGVTIRRASIGYDEAQANSYLVAVAAIPRRFAPSLSKFRKRYAGRLHCKQRSIDGRMDECHHFKPMPGRNNHEEASVDRGSPKALLETGSTLSHRDISCARSTRSGLVHNWHSFADCGQMQRTCNRPGLRTPDCFARPTFEPPPGMGIL